jgi:hypothetical protein
MRHTQPIRFLTAVVALATVSTVAHAQTVTRIDGWNEAASGFVPEWVAEGRIGGGSFESDLGPSTSAPAATADFVWQNGVARNFSLSYNSANGLALWTITGQSPSPISYIVPVADRNFSDIVIRAYAGPAGSSMVLSNLTYNASLLSISTLDQNGSATPHFGNFLHIRGANPSASFTLTGRATMSWTGNKPANSNVAFQIKLGTLPGNRIPEPASLLLVALGAVPFIAQRRRRTR